MTLSIIIPCYNAEPYIEHLIQRLKPQINDEVEVIVVDDGSDFPYLAPYEWVNVIRQKNKGLAGARNTGLKHAKGKYIAFIDADDLVAENFVDYVLSRSGEEWDYMDLSWKSLEDDTYVYRLKSDSDKLTNPSVCTKVWSRAFIGDQKFNEKKDVAEDEDFTRRIDLSRGKRICASHFMYYYRLKTPNSLSKQYRKGSTKTKRIVYYFKCIPPNDALLEELKAECELNEVIVMTNDNNDWIKEWVSKYANVTKPIGTWADELRGEPTNLVKVREKPMETQVVIYIDNAYAIGGIETFIYNFCKAMNKHYDILVLYGTQMEAKQIARLTPMVRVMKNNKAKTIKCDSLIMNRVFDNVPENVIYKKCFQMVHGCRDANPHRLPTEKGQIICVSSAVKESFGEEAANAEVLNNLVSSEKSKDMLLLVSASRFDTPEKGQERAVQLAKMLEKAGISYMWMYFSNRAIPGATSRMIKMEPTLDVREYIRKADYLVQLSDSEAFCYSIVEALIESTPVITTPLPVLEEIGVQDGANGYIVPFDMDFDVEKLLDIPSFKYAYNNRTIVLHWKKLLGNTKPTHSYKPEEAVNVRITRHYSDIELQKDVYPGEVYPMRKERAEQIERVGYGKIEWGE